MRDRQARGDGTKPLVSALPILAPELEGFHVAPSFSSLLFSTLFLQLTHNELTE